MSYVLESKSNSTILSMHTQRIQALGLIFHRWAETCILFVRFFFFLFFFRISPIWKEFWASTAGQYTLILPNQRFSLISWIDYDCKITHVGDHSWSRNSKNKMEKEIFLSMNSTFAYFTRVRFESADYSSSTRQGCAWGSVWDGHHIKDLNQ